MIHKTAATALAVKVGYPSKLLFAFPMNKLKELIDMTERVEEYERNNPNPQ